MITTELYLLVSENFEGELVEVTFEEYQAMENYIFDTLEKDEQKTVKCFIIGLKEYSREETEQPIIDED